MPLTITAHANCDDISIWWKADKAIPNCLGFELEREMTDAKGKAISTILENRTGFASKPGAPGEKRPSNAWPFQRFNWTDHGTAIGGKVRYRVTPMIVDAHGALHELLSERSAWTPNVSCSGAAGKGFEAYFNRGLVISQFMARYLGQMRKPGETMASVLKRFKASLSKHDEPIRLFLSGELRKAMVGTLADAKSKKRQVYGALYELDDEELMDGLKALKKSAHIVLANGSVKKKGDDQNKAARAAIKKAGCDVYNRMVSPKPLGHNKFLSIDGGGTAAALTGSTNWTRTGLCTQINNALIITDPGVAKIYKDQWNRLKAAQSAYPASLVSSNSTPKKAKVGGASVDVWFTRTNKGVDLKAIEDAVRGAKESVLFLMFQPGAAGTLSVVRDLEKKPGYYVRGVVSTLPVDKKTKVALPDKDAGKVDVELVGGSTRKPSLSLNIVQPMGIKAPFASWAATASRQDFLSNVGFAIVHSKTLVIDPFTKPVVITGSHNFSGAASKANDENFVIVRNNPDLAQAYAIHIMAVYQHYRWLSYVASQQSRRQDPWSGLTEDHDWMKKYLTKDRQKEIAFWTR